MYTVNNLLNGTSWLGDSCMREESEMWNTAQAKGHKSIPSTVSQGQKLQREKQWIKKTQQAERVEGEMNCAFGLGGNRTVRGMVESPRWTILM